MVKVIGYTTNGKVERICKKNELLGEVEELKGVGCNTIEAMDVRGNVVYQWPELKEKGKTA